MSIAPLGPIGRGDWRLRNKKTFVRKCTKENCHECPNMKETGNDWNTNYHNCEKCKLSYKTYEDEMQ